MFGEQTWSEMKTEIDSDISSLGEFEVITMVLPRSSLIIVCVKKILQVIFDIVTNY